VEHASISNNVPRETREALDRFVGVLLHWNRTVNLIAPGDESVVWERHIEDSLQLAPLMPPIHQRAIDLGSGAGFPGLILAIATGVRFDLIEADHRKAAFLREAARATQAPVQIHAIRIEAARLPPSPLVTARALAPLPRLLALAAPLLDAGGQCLFLKGANVRAELTQAESEWHMRTDIIPSRTASGASILRITDLSRVAATA
jgi:16S rRNA (guanine527-N7)-methyltransferase